MTYPPEITVNVTAEDIRDGKRKDCRFCPVARAVQRLFPNTAVHVSGLIKVSGDNLYKASDAGWSFILDFDMGHKVRPIAFTATRML